MKNLKVSAKLIVSFLIVISLSVLIGICGIVGMKQISSLMDDMYLSHTLPLADAANAVEYAQRLRVQMRNVVIYADDAEQMKKIKADVQIREATLLSYMEAYGKKIDDTEVGAQKLFDEAMNTLKNEFIPALNGIIASAEAGESQAALRAAMEATGPAADLVRNNILEIMTLSMNEAGVANEEGARAYNTQLIIVIGILAVSVLLSIILAIYISGLISKPLIVLSRFMKRAGSTGDITIGDADSALINKSSNGKDEISQTINGAAAFIQHITKIAGELEFVSGGDLTGELVLLSNDDTMGLSLKKMVDNLNSMFSEINSSTAQVSTGSAQIAGGAQALAQGSTQQAAAIQQVSSAISEIACKTKDNAKKAVHAATLANSIKDSAEKGSNQMDEMMNAVKEINDASHSISKVIKAIDDIAFQTNILSLNAAVEAARAGQHGKGFAVVAEEVRNLAAKSAEAAKNTGALIQNSMKKAEYGARIADETASSLSEIVTGINESSRLIGEIATSSEEQSLSVTQINTSIDQVAQVVQQNSATAEESAAASQEMSGQSDMLHQLITQFKLKEESIGHKGSLYLEKAAQRLTALPEKSHYAMAAAGNFSKY